MQESEIDEIIFQVLLSRMNGKKKYSKPIEEEAVLALMKAVQDVLADEPIILTVEPEAAIVGDIHGNIDDLIRIFERLRYPPQMKYVFMGDYVDRGIFGTEVLLLLLCLKVKYPQHILLLRGNHESQSLTSFYGFAQEVLSKYSTKVYSACIDVFHELPLCAIIGERILCLHGGISPDWDTIEQLASLEKPGEISGPGIFTDIVWSDPDQSIDEFLPNDRGCGYYYGTNALERFLDNNDLDLLVRSHELCLDGIAWPYVDHENCLDRCLTIFSNTNYCGRANEGVVLIVSEDLCVKIEKFEPLEEYQSKKVIMPVWLYGFITQKEAEAAKKIQNLGEEEESFLDEEEEENEEKLSEGNPDLEENQQVPYALDHEQVELQQLQEDDGQKPQDDIAHPIDYTSLPIFDHDDEEEVQEEEAGEDLNRLLYPVFSAPLVSA